MHSQQIIFVQCLVLENIHTPHGRELSYDPLPSGFSKISPQNIPPLPSRISKILANPLEMFPSPIEVKKKFTMG